MNNYVYNNSPVANESIETDFFQWCHNQWVKGYYDHTALTCPKIDSYRELKIDSKNN